jgi:hypothetical protein
LKRSNLIAAYSIVGFRVQPEILHGTLLHAIDDLDTQIRGLRFDFQPRPAQPPIAEHLRLAVDEEAGHAQLDREQDCLA